MGGKGVCGVGPVAASHGGMRAGLVCFSERVCRKWVCTSSTERGQWRSLCISPIISSTVDFGFRRYLCLRRRDSASVWVLGGAFSGWFGGSSLTGSVAGVCPVRVRCLWW